MKWIIYKYIIVLPFALGIQHIALSNNLDTIDFFKDPFIVNKSLTPVINLDTEANEQSIQNFYTEIEKENYRTLIDQLQSFKEEKQLNDWLYYQLIRKVAESFSPKKANYSQYTLYKWYLMMKSGYDARLAVGDNQIIFYIKNKEDISDIPFFIIDGKQFTCLNYHDYGKLFNQANVYKPINIYNAEASDFSYKISQMPDFKEQANTVKHVNFNYKNKEFKFDIKINENLNTVFKNYPGVDFETYFNIPLTKSTYESLIPVLKDNIKKLSTEDGVDYLMRFTRYSFLYENDQDNFGTEKRLSPEQTLMNDYSDCDDRAALFFFLVKEIYNLPMVAVLYPSHVTIGIRFNKKIGQTILYNGQYYTICEPTPQLQNLSIGELAEKYKTEKYKIVYQYIPN